MGTYDKFGTDANLEKTGIELDLGESGLFVLARAGGANEQFQKRFEALTKPHRRTIQAGVMDNSIAEGILARVYAECVILRWERVTGPDGQPLEFTVDNAMKLLTDLPDLFKVIQETASEASMYRAIEREADSGNS